MRTKKLLLVMLSSIAITACGGGGGNSSPSAFSATTSGVAAKGIIKHAVVTAYELNAAGSNVRTVGTSETDVAGKYALTIGSTYTGGPIKLVLSTKSDGTTKMVCDVSTGCGVGVAFGADYSLSSTFTLTSYQQAASNGAAITTQITPYTNMAAARIDAQINTTTPLDNTLVSNANSEVSQLVGVNITTTQPVDITNSTALAAASPDALQYAAFNAGIGNVAFASAGGFEAGITAAATSFADGQFTSTDPVTIGSLVTAVTTEANAPTTTGLNTTALNATLASITANTTVAGTYDPTPTPTATLTAVAQAKGLVSQTRTWGTQIQALKTPADAFKLDVNTAKGVLNSTSVGFVSVFGKVLKGAIDTVVTEANSTNGLMGKSYPYPLLFGTTTGIVSGVGIVTVSNNAGSLKLAFSSTVAGVTNSGTITTSIPSSILNAPFTKVNLAGLSLVVSGNATMSTPAVSFTLTNASLNVALKPTSATVNTATVLPTDIASLNINGNASLQANGVLTLPYQ